MRPALRVSLPRLSDQDLLDIARRATTLFELLEGPQAVAAPPAARAVLDAWAEAFAPGDPAAFARRLAWDGLTEARVAHALAGSTPAAAAEWTRWLDPFLEEAAALAAQLDSGPVTADAELQRLSPSPERPFLEVWVALVRCARRAVAARAESLDGIAPEAHADLERALVAELSATGELVLFEHFRKHRDAWEPASGDPYASFVTGLLSGGLASVFRDYPVLARGFARLVSTWTDTTLELLARLHRDRDAVARLLGVETPGDLVAVSAGLSDRHDGGRRVSLLTFACGRRIVYKPRDVGVESAFEQFLAALSERGMPGLPAAVRVLERDGYGWAECVDQEPFEERRQVEDYFRQAGALACLLHVLRGTDAHQENVVATRRGPSLIDAEMLLQPVDRNEAMDERADGLIDGAAHGVRRSCLSSGLVTLVDVDGEGRAYDVGGLVPLAPRTAALGERAWRGLGSGALDFVRDRAVHPTARNQVVLNGAVQRPQWFAMEVRAGFATAYRFVLAERERLFEDDGPLAVFAGRRCRMLFRPSDQYGVYLQALSAPRYQKSGLERGIALDTLNRVFRHEEQRPRLWPLVAEERRALEALDIPRYALPVDEDGLRTASGERIDGHLVRSGMTAVRAGLGEMSEEDLARQLDLLASALETDARGSEASGADADPALAWQRAAEHLGDALLARRRTRGDGTPSWSDCDAQGPHGRHDLYRGEAGLGVFFAALAAVTDARRFREAVVSLRPSFAGMLDAPGPASPSGWPAIGACSGLGSIVYSLATIGRLLQDPAWTELAWRAARELSSERIERDSQLDVAGGTAGALLALLALDPALEEPWLRERVHDAVRRLLATQVSTGAGGAAWPGYGGTPLAGFAHGAAGIAYALSRVHAVTGDAHLEQAVGRAHLYERQLFSPAAGNWPSSHATGAVMMTAWCYGAPGIGLARALGSAALRDDETLAEIHAAMDTTAKAAVGRLDHLCCGNLGRGEALLAISERLGHAGAARAAGALATRVAERVCAAGRFGVRTEGFEHRTFHPGFFRGLAGVGYHLLRSAAPSRLPSILAFESESAQKP